MKRLKEILFLVFGTLLFIASYKFDGAVNQFFKNIKFPLLDSVLSVITSFAVVIAVMLVIPLFLLYKDKRKMSLLIWAFIISVVLAFIIKLLVLRQRPAEILYYPLFNIINYSFPSMHAMVVFSLLPILMEYLPKQKNFWVLFAFIVSFTRIYFGFHFLSDVVFGAFLGYFVGSYLLSLNRKKKLWFK